MMKRKVTILGTEYELVEDETIMQADMDGVCQPYRRNITIAPMGKMLDETDSEEDKKRRYGEVLRHEIVHAFFHESGLEEYRNNEDLVSWISLMFPKMLELFEGLDCTGKKTGKEEDEWYC